MFVDRVAIFVRGGDGGNGCLSFRREKYAPRGGPNGGDGGDGGSIVVRATESHTNLAHLSHQRHWKADRGEHGQGSDCFGRGGEDMIIEVPPGTLIRNRDDDQLLRDLKTAGDQVVEPGADAEDTVTPISNRRPIEPLASSRRAIPVKSARSPWN